MNVLPMPVNSNMGFSYTRFASHAAYLSELQRIRDINPSLVSIHTGSASITGMMPIYYLTVGDTSKPAFFLVSALHCKNEWYGANIITRFIEKLVTPGDNQRVFHAALLKHYCVIAVPMANVWGYYQLPDGAHHNGHDYVLPRLAELTWHSKALYSQYYGVNLNRNFDIGWGAFEDIPFSVYDYWTPPGLDDRGINQANGSYNFANYFMMPYVMVGGVKTYDDTNGYGLYNNHLLEPDTALYDGKGTAAFSEPETSLIRDLVDSFNVVGFFDLHTLNPWQTNNVSYISSTVNRQDMIDLINGAISAVNGRNVDTDIPACNHVVMEDYGTGNMPYSVNWAQNVKGIKAVGWEIGTNFLPATWTDAYFEIIYRALYWMQQDITITPQLLPVKELVDGDWVETERTTLIKNIVGLVQ